MKLDHEYYNQMFLEHANSGKPLYNDALPYGVTVERVGDGENMKAIGIHHLLPAENEGGHAIYLDVLDKDGKRVNGAQVNAQNANGQTITAVIDKPENEPGANIVMWKNDRYSVWAEGGEGSDVALDLNTWHPDEPPGGNTLYHHSFYIVFQLRGSDDTTNPPDPGTDPPQTRTYTIKTRTIVTISDGETEQVVSDMTEEKEVNL